MSQNQNIQIQKILQQIDWPIEILVIDFETFFSQEYSLSKISTVEYITDSRFEFTGLGFEILNHPKANGPIFIPGPDVPWAIKRLKKLFGKAFHNCTVVAKNCKFDILILLEKFGIHPPFIIDIEDLSRFYDSRMSHKLKDLAPMFNLEAKGDTKQFKGQHWEDMDHRAMKNYNLGDIRNETALLQILLPIISNPEIEILLARHTLGMYLSPHFKMDYVLADQLTFKMDQELQKTIKQSGHTAEEISGTLSFTKLLIDITSDGIIPVKHGKPGKNMVKLLGQPGVVPQLAKTDEGFKQMLNSSDEKMRILMQAKVASKSWPSHIKRIQSLVAQCKVSNDLLRVPLKYYGAHTGRWSGTEKINVQNFGGAGRGTGIHSLIKKMRNMLIAPEGEILAITDSAQIEARILAWITGQTDLTQDFIDDKSPYCTIATTLFGEKVWKPSEEEKKTSKGQKIAIQYGFGKDSILGCGYGMGPVKFYLNCIANNNLRPLFKEPPTFDENLLQKIMQQYTKDLKAHGLKNYKVPESGKYDMEFIAYLILTYRDTYKKIPEFWTRIEKAFRYVIKYPGEVISLWHDGLPLRQSLAEKPLFTFWKSSNTVHLQLPSGRVLNYRHACLDKKKTIKYHWGHLWGGAITENVVQSIARDLLGYWVLECEKRIGPVVLHSHDEIVCVVDKSEATDKLSEMIKIFSTGPDWAGGLPLAAEGQLTEMYVK